MLLAPFSQSWQFFTETKDLLVYAESQFSLNNTLSGPDEAKMTKNIAIFFASSY